jgi:hypothetical protein
MVRKTLLIIVGTLMSFIINAEGFATFKHTGVGFEVSYPQHWTNRLNDESELDFTPDYVPTEDDDFLIVLEAGKAGTGELELITIGVEYNSIDDPAECVNNVVNTLLKGNEIQPDSIIIASELQLKKPVNIQFQKLKYLGIDTLIGCFRVKNHIVTMQIMLAKENSELEKNILESVFINL